VTAALIGLAVFVGWFALACEIVILGARLADDNRADDLLPDEPVPYWPNYYGSLPSLTEGELRLVHSALIASSEFRAAMREALGDEIYVSEATKRIHARVMDEVADPRSLEGVTS
jgi:hypothetical protein